jgi:S-adenosylmethionine:tRNA ribosyltransferase-isomerase
MSKLADFAFELPSSAIAKFPLQKREGSRMLQLSRSEDSFSHQSFVDLIDHLEADDLLVLNDTKVLPCRMYAKKPTGGKVEIFILDIIDNRHARALLRAHRSLPSGLQLDLEEDSSQITILEKIADHYLLALDGPFDFTEILNRCGQMPLPPYLKRNSSEDDFQRYQTVYAKALGAVACPTAGLHFSKTFLSTLRAKGVRVAYITLHVGLGTFQPLKVENIEDHRMHAERYIVPEKTCALWHEAKRSGKRIIAVGTTALRALESAYALNGLETEVCAETQLFIYPGYPIRTVDGLLTNFHLPGSSLLLLVAAFIGRSRLLAAYHEAIKQKYRFYSYGDAMLIL